MPQSFSTQCPNCETKLRLKNRNKAGRKVACPKCGEPFVVRIPDDESERATKRSRTRSPKLPPKTRKRNPSPVGRRKPKEPPVEAGFSVGGLFSLIVWINAHIAVAWCVVDNAIDFVWLVTHFNEVLQQAGLGRFAVRRMGRPLLIIITAGMIWFQSVLPRDIRTRPAAFLFGGGYLVLFGGVAFLIGLIASSVYERPVYAIQWSVVYLGFSLLLFAVWGFGPEAPMQYAERLMTNGRFHEAPVVVQKELEKDEDNIPAIKLEKTLRDMMRMR